MASLTPSPFMQFMDANGEPLVGGLLYTYASGTTTPLTTYTDATGTVPNANPVVLDTTGSAAVWLGTSLYTFVLKTSTNTLVWTSDGVGGVDSTAFTALVAAVAALTTVVAGKAAKGTNADITQLTALVNSVASQAAIFSTPLINIPDPTKAFKEVTRYEGGEAKYGKWRQYHNAAEWGWGMTYNFAMDPYGVFPATHSTRDVWNTTGSACLATRFNLSEGTSGANFWGVEWAPPSTTQTVPDFTWGPKMYFYQGDCLGGTPGDAGGTLRIASSAGRISGIILESNNSITPRNYIARSTFEGAYEVADISSWNNWNSMPGAAIGIKRLQLRSYGLKAYQGTLTNVQRTVPLTGTTVTATISTELLALEAPGAIATLTVVFPDVTASGLNETGRRFTIATYNTVTAITLSAPGTNILGGITTLVGGTSASWTYFTDLAGTVTWFRT